MSLEMNVKEMTIALHFKLPKKYQSAVILSPEENVFIFPVKEWGPLYHEPSLSTFVPISQSHQIVMSSSHQWE